MLVESNQLAVGNCGATHAALHHFHRQLSQAQTKQQAVIMCSDQASTTSTGNCLKVRPSNRPSSRAVTSTPGSRLSFELQAMGDEPGPSQLSAPLSPVGDTASLLSETFVRHLIREVVAAVAAALSNPVSSPASTGELHGGGQGY